MGKTGKYIVLGLVCLALLGFGYLGYTLYPKFNKCPQIEADTVFIIDTNTYYIPDTIPWYIVTHDTTIIRDTIPQIIDTLAILEDYFAYHYYERSWDDSLIHVTIKDVISENMPIRDDFFYRIKRPQTVINNVVNNISYNRMLYAGAGLSLSDIKYHNIEILYTTNRFYTGVSYYPYIKGFTVKGGVQIWKWK